jgi:hypothetical protein
MDETFRRGLILCFIFDVSERALGSFHLSPGLRIPISNLETEYGWSGEMP